MGDAEKASEARPLGLRARLLLVLVLVLVPLAFFGLLEGGLRLAGYGEDDRLIISYEQLPGWLQVNPAVGLRYFADREQLRVPPFEVFPAERHPDDVRLVFQGASTGVGFPFNAHAAPARAVEYRLRELFPGRTIDVINTSMTAVNSYTLLDLADEIAALEPDAVLIYAGHNEFYGVLGVGSAESVGRWRPLVLTYLALSRLRTFQLLRDAVHAVRGNGEGDAASPPGGPGGGTAGRDAPPGAGADPTPMERLAGDEGIPFGSELYRAGLAQYRANLSALLAAYRERGIPVLVATLVSNEKDLAPFIGGPTVPLDSARWSDARGRAARALEAGDTAGATAAIEALLALDSLAADPWFLRGRLAEGTGAWAEARVAYGAARDRDQLRFRAPSDFNGILRAEAERHGARVVEVEAAFRDASPRELVGDELVTEHVHPNLRGYALLAHAFLEGLREAGIPDGWDEAPALEPPGAAPPLTTALDSVLGHYRLTALLGGWPFRPRGRREPLSVTPRTLVDTLALRLYRGQALWMQAAGELAGRREAEGALEEAYVLQRAMAAEFPVVPHFYADAARLAVDLGRLEEAERLLEAARKRGELPLIPRVEGRLHLARGQTEQGIRLLEEAAAAADERASALLDSIRGASGGGG